MICCLCPGLLWAHGMVYEVAEKQAITITAMYDDGEAMSYADVKIFSPDNDKLEHQNGRTDKNGSFAFMPDTDGVWRIVVDGGMGHVISTTFAVDANLVLEAGAFINQPRAHWQGVMAGLGFIFGITGVYLYLRSRPRPGSPQT